MRAVRPTTGSDPQGSRQRGRGVPGRAHRDKYPTLETKQMIESIVATDYDGRTLIELLQNAHDAHPPEPGMVGSTCNLMLGLVNVARST